MKLLMFILLSSLTMFHEISGFDGRDLVSHYENEEEEWYTSKSLDERFINACIRNKQTGSFSGKTIEYSSGSGNTVHCSEKAVSPEEAQSMFSKLEKAYLEYQGKGKNIKSAAKK